MCKEKEEKRYAKIFAAYSPQIAQIYTDEFTGRWVIFMYLANCRY